MGSERLGRAGILVGIGRLVIKRSGGEHLQHGVVTATLNDHQRGGGLLLGQLIDQLMESLLRGHLPMVPAVGAC